MKVSLILDSAYLEMGVSTLNWWVWSIKVGVATNLLRALCAYTIKHPLCKILDMPGQPAHHLILVHHVTWETMTSVVFVHVLSMLSSAVSLFITIMSCDAFTCYMLLYLRFHFTCDQSVLSFVSLC